MYLRASDQPVAFPVGTLRDLTGFVGKPVAFVRAVQDRSTILPWFVGPNDYVHAPAVVHFRKHPLARPILEFLVVALALAKADVAALGDSTPAVDGKAIRGFAVVPFAPVSPLCWFLLVRHS